MIEKDELKPNISESELIQIAGSLTDEWEILKQLDSKDNTHLIYEFTEVCKRTIARVSELSQEGDAIKTKSAYIIDCSPEDFSVFAKLNKKLGYYGANN